MLKIPKKIPIFKNKLKKIALHFKTQSYFNTFKQYTMEKKIKYLSQEEAR